MLKFGFTMVLLALAIIGIGQCTLLTLNRRTGSEGSVKTGNADLQHLAVRAVELWNKKQENRTRLFKLKRINNATSQIVSGVLYTLHVTLQETECTKTNNDSTYNTDKCLVTSVPNEIDCLLKVWNKAWIGFVELTEFVNYS